MRFDHGLLHQERFLSGAESMGVPENLRAGQVRDEREDAGTPCGWRSNLSVCHMERGTEKVGLLGKNKAEAQRGGEGRDGETLRTLCETPLLDH